MITLNRLFLIFSCIIGAAVLIAVAPIKTKEKKSDADVHIIFDLNGVLVRQANETKVLGVEKFIKLALLKCFTLQNPLSIKKSLRKAFFNFLNTIESKSSDEIIAYDEQGQPLPNIMCDWMLGTYTPQELLAKVNRAEKEHKKGLEISIAASIARMIFDPHTFIQIVEWIPEALEFVQELKDDGCKVYILSNWDPHSFQLMQEKYADILNLFDGIMISGTVGKLKPDLGIYKKFIKQFNINPDRALFFDDQAANVQGGIDADIESKLCLQEKKIFGSPMPNIHDLRNYYHQWRYHEHHKSESESAIT